MTLNKLIIVLQNLKVISLFYMFFFEEFLNNPCPSPVTEGPTQAQLLINLQQHAQIIEMQKQKLFELTNQVFFLFILIFLLLLFVFLLFYLLYIFFLRFHVKFLIKSWFQTHLFLPNRGSIFVFFSSIFALEKKRFFAFKATLFQKMLSVVNKKTVKSQ